MVALVTYCKLLLSLIYRSPPTKQKPENNLLNSLGIVFVGIGDLLAYTRDVYQELFQSVQNYFLASMHIQMIPRGF